MKNRLLLVLFVLPLVAFGQYPLKTIQDIQTVNSTSLANCQDSSMYAGDTVTVTGVVVMDGGLAQAAGGHNIWIQSGLGAFSGLDVFGGPSSNYNNVNQPVNQLVAGMQVQITGYIEEYQGETELIPIPGNNVTILSSGNAVQSQVISLGDLNDANKNNQLTTGEQWEGAFVELQNVTVTAVSYFSSNTRVSFDVVDASGNKINVSDRFLAQRLPANGGTFVPPNVGDVYSSIKGVIMHSKNNCPGLNGRGYEIHPFSSTHYVLGAASPTIINVQRNHITPTSSQNVTITADITDADGTVTSATLYYAVGAGNNSYTSVPMTITTGSTYTANIPLQTDGSFVKYYVSAMDNNNNVTTVPTATPSTGTYFYTVRDNGTTIYDVQFTPYSNGNSGYVDKTVTVTGVVTASAKTNDLGYVYIQQENQLSWAGLMLTGNASLATLNRGDKVTVTGTIKEDFGFTRMESVSAISNAGTGVITPLTLDPTVFASYDFNTNEPYEGMLVSLENPAAGQKLHVVDVNADATGTSPNFGEYRVGTDNFDPNNGTRVVAGRQSGTSYSSLWVSLVNDNTWSTTDGAMNVPVVLVDDSMHMDALRGIMYYSFSNFKILPRNNADFVGLNTTLPTSVSDVYANGNTRIFPNPATNAVQVSTSHETTCVLSLFDLSGREVISGVKINGNGVVDVSSLKAGYYIVRMLDNRGDVVHIQKLSITK